jgi:hypothetical protein
VKCSDIGRSEAVALKTAMMLSGIPEFTLSIITGAAQVIGRRTAELLAQRAYTLALKQNGQCSRKDRVQFVRNVLLSEFTTS